MDIQININKIVNHLSEQREVDILEHVFKLSDGFRGAVGTAYRYYSFREYKYLTSKSNIMEKIQELALPLGYNSYSQAFKAMKANNEIRSFIFDEPEDSLQEMIREELNLQKKDAYIFSCIRAGRMFSKKYFCGINSQLTDLIRKYES